jgi:hypothetical protein
MEKVNKIVSNYCFEMYPTLPLTCLKYDTLGRLSDISFVKQLTFIDSAIEMRLFALYILIQERESSVIKL